MFILSLFKKVLYGRLSKWILIFKVVEKIFIINFLYYLFEVYIYFCKCKLMLIVVVWVLELDGFEIDLSMFELNLEELYFKIFFY